MSVSTTRNFLDLFFSERGGGTSKDFVTVLEKKKRDFFRPFLLLYCFLVHSLRVVVPGMILRKDSKLWKSV